MAKKRHPKSKSKQDKPKVLPNPETAPIPESTQSVLSKYSPQLNLSLQKNNYWEKLWRFSESNLFWGGGVAVALAAYAFLLTGALKFSILLLAVAWIVITISIYKHKFFESKARKHQIIGNSFISLFIGVVFCLIWIWMQPAPQAIPSTTEAQPLKEPTFTEGYDRVKLTLGSMTSTESLSELKTPKTVFNFREIEVKLYVENNKPYVDIPIVLRYGKPYVYLQHNKLINRPTNWDLNSDDKALEVMDESGRPIFQFYYKTPSHLVVNGLFKVGNGAVLAYEEKLIYQGFKVPENPIKPIFKYPSSDYPGQRLK